MQWSDRIQTESKMNPKYSVNKLLQVFKFFICCQVQSTTVNHSKSCNIFPSTHCKVSELTTALSFHVCMEHDNPEIAMIIIKTFWHPLFLRKKSNITATRLVMFCSFNKTTVGRGVVFWLCLEGCFAARSLEVRFWDCCLVLAHKVIKFMCAIKVCRCGSWYFVFSIKHFGLVLACWSGNMNKSRLTPIYLWPSCTTHTEKRHVVARLVVQFGSVHTHFLIVNAVANTCIFRELIQL